MSTPSSKEPRSLLSDQSSSSSQGNAGAALLGGPPSSDVDQSPLERLIAQSTSEQAAAAAASTPFFIEDNPELPHYRNNVAREPVPPSPAAILRTTIITLAAGTLCFLQICLVWASFLSNAWFDTHLKITVGRSSQQQLQFTSEMLQNFEFSTDQTLQKTTLASLLSMLLGADQGWPAMILVLTCLISPCLCMVLYPSWTVGDYQEAIQPSHRSSRRIAAHADLLGFNPRILGELFLVRICFLAFFLLAILDVGTSSLALENNHSEFLVTNRTRGGVVCYTLGMACALGVVVLLRIASQSAYHPSPTMGNTSDVSSPHYTRQERPIAPPDQAFQELHRPLLLDDDLEQTESGVSPGSQPRTSTGVDLQFPFWKRLIVYEMGILTTVLWIPALFLPLFRITFGGLVASFMEEVSFEVPFYQLPSVLLQRGIAARTDRWMLLSLGIVLLSLVYIFPLFATATAVAAWRSPTDSKAVWFYKSILRYLQPCLCGVIFSLSLRLAVPAFEPLGDYLLNTQTSGFCRRFEDVTDTACLIIHGEHSLGQWFLLAQSVSLEIFVILTLTWKT